VKKQKAGAGLERDMDNQKPTQAILERLASLGLTEIYSAGHLHSAA
jgi:hypothetical protein